MAEQIEGIHIDIKGTELQERFTQLAEYHATKVEEYEKKRVDLARIDAELAKEAAEIGKYTSNNRGSDTIVSLIDRHKDQAVYCKFMAEHVVVSATYRLDEGDLAKIGVTKRHAF